MSNEAACPYCGSRHITHTGVANPRATLAFGVVPVCNRCGKTGERIWVSPYKGDTPRVVRHGEK